MIFFFKYIFLHGWIDMGFFLGLLICLVHLSWTFVVTSCIDRLLGKFADKLPLSRKCVAFSIEFIAYELMSFFIHINIIFEKRNSLKMYFIFLCYFNCICQLRSPLINIQLCNWCSSMKSHERNGNWKYANFCFYYCFADDQLWICSWKMPIFSVGLTVFHDN